MANKIKIRELVSAKKFLKYEVDEITFWKLNTIKKYFCDLARNVTNRYGDKIRALDVELCWNPNPNSEIAYTDNYKIVINLANNLVSEYSRADKFLLAIGLLAHECGHVLFTDFTLINEFSDLNVGEKSEKYRWDSLSPEAIEWAKKNIALFRKIILSISNITEDPYVELRISNKYSGSFKDGIIAITTLLTDQLVATTNEADFMGYLLRLARNCLPNEFFDDECWQKNQLIMNDIISEPYPTAIERFNYSFDIFNNIFEHYIKNISSENNSKNSEKNNSDNSENNQNASNSSENSNSRNNTDDLSDNKEQTNSASSKNTDNNDRSDANSNNDNSDGSSNSNNSDNSDNVNNSKGSSNTETTDGSEVTASGNGENSEEHASNSDASSVSNNSGNNGKNELSDEEINDIMNEALKKLNKEKSSCPSHSHSNTMNSTGIADSENDSSELDNSKNNNPSHKNSDEIFTNALDTMIDENSEEAVEMLRKNLTINTITSAFSGHAGVDYIVEKIDDSDFYKSYYDTYFEEISCISKSCANKIADKVMQHKKSFKNNRQKKGSKIDLKAYSRRTSDTDLSVFSNRTKQNKKPFVVVSTVVDCSYSMDGERMTAAKKTAILIEDFCARLEIPNACIGHTTMRSQGKQRVRITDCFDFEHSKNKRYNILALNAKKSNRDGYVFRYALNALDKRKEPFKVMMILSDGLPNAQGYAGEDAKKDIQDFLKLAKSHGVTVLSFCIGDNSSYERLVDIYGDIVDCSDLEKAPFEISKALEKASSKAYK